MDITVPIIFYFSNRTDASTTLFIKSEPEYPTMNQREYKNQQ